jgi:hypothetical protein
MSKQAHGQAGSLLSARTGRAGEEGGVRVRVVDVASRLGPRVSCVPGSRAGACLGRGRCPGRRSACPSPRRVAQAHGCRGARAAAAPARQRGAAPCGGAHTDRTCPGVSAAELAMLLSFISTATDVPKAEAMPASWLPSRTVYEEQPPAVTAQGQRAAGSALPAARAASPLPGCSLQCAGNPGHRRRQHLGTARKCSRPRCPGRWRSQTSCGARRRTGEPQPRPVPAAAPGAMAGGLRGRVGTERSEQPGPHLQHLSPSPCTKVLHLPSASHASAHCTAVTPSSGQSPTHSDGAVLSKPTPFARCPAAKEHRVSVGRSDTARRTRRRVRAGPRQRRAQGA